MLILDTDHVTLMEWAEGAAAERFRVRLERAGTGEYATTIVSYEEQSRGWLAYLSKARTLAQQIAAYGKLSRHLDVYRTIPVLEFDERAAVELQRLRQARLRGGTMDLKIAAIVLAHDATLLSRNRADFGRVPGLKVEDGTI
jgi:tRNA(fMet)-specific endonuclease VapC